MIVIIGTGPSGVAVARPLIATGAPVLWLDAGDHYNRVTLPAQPYDAIAPGSPLSRLVINDMAVAGGNDSPKLRAPSIHGLLWPNDRHPAISTDNFRLVGSFTAGGLSNAWGAMVASYSQAELGIDRPTWDGIADAYRALAAEIGISGPRASPSTTVDTVLCDVDSLQDPLPLDAPVDALFARYVAAGANGGPAHLGRPYQALLTSEHASRPACDRRLMCLWGCSRGSVYSARYSLSELAQAQNVDYRPNHRVTAIQRQQDGRFALSVDAVGRIETVMADRVILAAGAPQSVALTLDCARPENATTRILSTPSFASVLIAPAQLGRTAQRTGYSMAQLSWSTGGADPVSGAIYATDGLPMSEIARHFPLTRRGSALFGQALISAMMPVNGFLSSDYSDNRAELLRDSHGTATLKITGAHTTTALATARAAIRDLAATARACGAMMIPGSFRMVGPGADIHYGGGLPMAQEKGPASPLQTDALGQLGALPGLHIVDGAVLPRLTSAHPTFTMMANARRIGKAIASRLQGS